jgi:small-conductance mechanosensitive channel
MIGIISFLLVVVPANILTYYVANPVYHSGVNFVNGNFWLLVLIAVILLVADLFGAFPFPLNLPAPIIKAIGSVFCIAFILRVFQWVDTVTAMNLYPAFWFVSFLVVPLVFLIVLATGYFEIMRRVWKQPNLDGDIGVNVVQQESFEDSEHLLSEVKSWEEIGTEFRMMLYDIIHRFREEIKKGR